MNVNITSELNKYHWRLFQCEEILFLFVCGNDEANIYVKKDVMKEFLPMNSYKDKTNNWMVCKDDINFKICEMIIHEKEGWKKEVLLYHGSETKLLRGLCKAILDPSFKELKCHHPSGFTRLGNFLSTLIKREN